MSDLLLSAKSHGHKTVPVFALRLEKLFERHSLGLNYSKEDTDFVIQTTRRAITDEDLELLRNISRFSGDVLSVELGTREELDALIERLER